VTAQYILMHHLPQNTNELGHAGNTPTEFVSVLKCWATVMVHTRMKIKVGFANLRCEVGGALVVEEIVELASVPRLLDLVQGSSFRVRGASFPSLSNIGLQR